MKTNTATNESTTATGEDRARDAALYYSEIQGFSVIPIKPGTKEPAVPWTPYQSERPSDALLESWFGSNGQYDIGIVTGKLSGIVVVDLDSKEAVKYVREHGFPKTPTVKTGKGYHLYYAYPPDREVRNFQKRPDLPGIDLRGEGGYVVAPPSLHSSGVRYRWLPGRGLDDLPLAKLPEILLAPQGSHAKVIDINNGVPEGERNNALTRLVGSWARLGLSYEESLSKANEWNKKNQPPLDEREVEKTVRSIVDLHKRNEQTKAETGQSTSDPWERLKTGKELRELDLSIEYDVDKLLPKNSVTVFYGRHGLGKTWVALALAEAVSAGTPFLGFQTRKQPVGYVDFENSLETLSDRAKKLGLGEMKFWLSSDDPPPPKLSDDSWKQYIKFPEGLIIFDTLRASQRKDENDSKQMAEIMGRLKALRDHHHTVIVLHHTPKQDASMYKGSTAILDLADHSLCLTEVKTDEEGNQTFQLAIGQKTRFERFDPIFLRQEEEGTIVLAPDPDEETLKALQQVVTQFKAEKGKKPNNGEFRGKAREKLELTDRDIRRLLKKGEGRYWHVEYAKGDHNQKLYDVVSGTDTCKT